jgi:ferritin
VDYIANRGGAVKLTAIAEPLAKYKSLLDVFRNVLQHEEDVTAAINGLYDLAASVKDYATQTLLDWYVNEQVEEENQPMEIISLLERVGDSASGLLMIDRHLASRARDA